LIEQREHVVPEDIQAVLPSVIGHRLQARDEQATVDVVSDLISHVTII